MTDELIKRPERVERAIRELNAAFIDAMVYAQDAFALVKYVRALEAANARIAGLEADRDAMMSALAECRDAMTIPEAGAPIEGHWASAMADPLEVPGYIRAALAQPLEAQADARWQPIETAPKDGTEVWAFNGEQARMLWSEGQEWALWVWADQLLADADPEPDQPTHWQPLPAAPAALSQKAGEKE